MTTLTIKLPRELKKQVEAEARLSGKSISALVRESLRNRAATKKGSRRLSFYERTSDLCGIGASGLRDLATNPKHLRDFGAWRK
ncbi:MAG TPA: CopG family transcriptional regulator [Chthoniobacterales bacterium]|jgi:hypothetical protein|nr:CopG family transcriptional regulator [Chthoniobacterales bacterium]